MRNLWYALLLLAQAKMVGYEKFMVCFVVTSSSQNAFFAVTFGSYNTRYLSVKEWIQLKIKQAICANSCLVLISRYAVHTDKILSQACLSVKPHFAFSLPFLV